MSEHKTRGTAATPPAGISRRRFVTTVAGAGTAFMIVPRHVLGRGLHGFLERGWLRPAVLAFSTVSALIVLADVAL